MSEPLERTFECGRCEARGVVVLAAQFSKTPWKLVEDHALAGGEGMSKQDDATSTLGLVRCPSCGERSRFAVPASVLRVIGYAVGGFLALWLIGGRLLRYAMIRAVPFAGWMLILFLLAAAGAAVEVRRWRSAARVSFLKVRPGPAGNLPVAIARKLPRAPSTPPIAPLRTTAPELVQRAADDEGPRFLKRD
jgi:transcription elongation factor Elf1